jgi:hypothetical protein
VTARSQTRLVCEFLDDRQPRHPAYSRNDPESSGIARVVRTEETAWQAEGSTTKKVGAGAV